MSKSKQNQIYVLFCSINNEDIAIQSYQRQRIPRSVKPSVLNIQRIQLSIALCSLLQDVKVRVIYKQKHYQDNKHVCYNPFKHPEWFDLGYFPHFYCEWEMGVASYFKTVSNTKLTIHTHWREYIFYSTSVIS